MTTADYARLADLTGAQIGVSEWVSVDQAMIDRFAAATGDRQWIHVDRDRAGRELGGTIAHGFLILSLIAHLGDSMLTVRGSPRRLNYGLNRVRFPAPVPSGARVRLTQTVRRVEPKDGGTLLTLDCRMDLEGRDRPACVAEHLMYFVPGETA